MWLHKVAFFNLKRDIVRNAVLDKSYLRTRKNYSPTLQWPEINQPRILRWAHDNLFEFLLNTENNKKSERSGTNSHTNQMHE